MSTPATPAPPTGETPPFDLKDFIKRRNEEEHAERTVQPTVPAAAPPADQALPAAAPATPGVPAAEPAETHLSRADRRKLSKLAQDAAYERGRREELERQLALVRQPAPGTPAPAAASSAADAKPAREAFASDAEFHEALGRWGARQELAKLNVPTKADLTRQQEMEQFIRNCQEADAVFAQQTATIPNFDSLIERAADDPEQPTWNKEDQPTLQAMLAASRNRAYVLAYMAENPGDVKELLGMVKNPAAQVAFFHAIEFHASKLYSKPSGKKEPAAPDPKPSQAQRDAAKAKPSEAITPTGGHAVPDNIPMLLADGHTINPAWKAKRNAEMGLKP